MNPVARARHVLARRPWLYWSVVARPRRAAPAGRSPPPRPASTRPAGRGARPATCVVATDDLRPARRSPAGSPCDHAPHRRCRRRRRDVGARRTPSPASTSPPARCSSADDVAADGGPQALIPDGWLAVAVAEAGAVRRRASVTTWRRVGRRRRARRRRRRRRVTRPRRCSSPCPPTTAPQVAHAAAVRRAVACSLSPVIALSAPAGRRRRTSTATPATTR